VSSRYSSLSRDRLAVLVPELLLIGQLIDRSGMAWCIEAFGREGMQQVAIEEWTAASPIYTRRMQRALGYEGDDVVTIFKGLQLDIGAPPQFMDFRYTVHDPWHGEFHLDHCGALMDVEPMGPDFVRGMCHDIEDPTFDATAVATNAHARVRPVHRPPRMPADRSPHCAWTVTIDESYPPVTESADCTALRFSAAARLALDTIDPAGVGLADYSGPLLSDLDFSAFSHSALVRMADEVCLQMHLLVLGFRRAVARRVDATTERAITRKQLVGISGVAAGRIRSALSIPASAEGALQVLLLHPLLNPAAYVDVEPGEVLVLRPSPAHADGAWITLCGPDSVSPLQAAVRAVDPYLDVEVAGIADAWALAVVRRDQRAPVADEVAVTRISTGAAFAFQPRRSLPITAV